MKIAQILERCVVARGKARQAAWAMCKKQWRGKGERRAGQQHSRAAIT